MTVKNCDLAKEILMLLPYIDKECLKKLPWNFINNLKDLASLSTKNYNFEGATNFKEMDISEECRDFLAMLYFNDCKLEEKKALLNTWNYNELNSN